MYQVDPKWVCFGDFYKEMLRTAGKYQSMLSGEKLREFEEIDAPLSMLLQSIVYSKL